MRFRIDLKIFLFLLLYFLTNQVQTYIVIILFAIIHELGHLIAGLILGMKPEKIELMPYGLSVSFKLIPKDYNKQIYNGNLLSVKKIIVAFAGPITNLIIIVIVSNLFPNLVIIYANLLLMIFNLLPIYPLDGGRIIKQILHIIFGKKEAEKYMNNISFITLIFITFIGSILIYYMKNISIFIIVIFLWVLYIKQDIIYKRKIKIYNLIEKTIEIKENK